MLGGAVVVVGGGALPAGEPSRCCFGCAGVSLPRAGFGASSVTREIGSEAREGVQALCDALKDKNWQIRQSAEAALWTIRGPGS